MIDELFQISYSNIVQEKILIDHSAMVNAYWAGIDGSMNDYSEAKAEGSYIVGIKAGKGGEYWLKQYKETKKENP